MPIYTHSLSLSPSRHPSLNAIETRSPPSASIVLDLTISLPEDAISKAQQTKASITRNVNLAHDLMRHHIA